MPKIASRALWFLLALAAVLVCVSAVVSLIWPRR